MVYLSLLRKIKLPSANMDNKVNKTGYRQPVKAYSLYCQTVMWHKKKDNSMIRLKEIGIIILLLLLVTCNNQGTSKKSKHQNTVNESLTLDSLQVKDSSSQKIVDLPDIENISAIWAYDIKADSIVQIKEVNKDTLTYEKLINMINTGYKNMVLIDFSRIAHDTIFIAIKNPEYLTQQMGSTGAFEFMITTTFTLTELRGIACVSFDFQEGDHASPGTYSRKYYWDWIKENRKLNKK